MKITQTEKERLSDGGLLTLTKLGYKYSVMRGFTSLDDAPEITQGLTKKEAYLYFEDIFKADVLDLI